MGELDERLRSVARLDAGPGRVVIQPPASGTFDGGGLLSTERAVCEPIDPADLQSIDDDPLQPLGVRLIDAGLKLWVYTEARLAMDLVELSITYTTTMNSLLTDPVKLEAYVLAAGLAYSEYVRDYFAGYVDMLVAMWDFLIRSGECTIAIAGLTAEAVLGLTDSPDWDAAVTSMTGACAPFIDVVLALAQVNAFFEALRDHPLDMVGAALEVVAEFAVAAVEKMTDGEIITELASFASNHISIGEFHGTLLGIIMAEVIIDELLTAGAGKVLRGVRWVKKVPTP
ncbi:hypothetical protein AB0M36_06875 [Actinoplanes sp. NPDC051346]|uniref:hypothetical protein n=1 Tax=Actinoplanes sp. NPDC051346 TaxID=3155048 RepID=UPI0034281751